MLAECSPVRAPLDSQWIFWIPRPISGRPLLDSAAAGSEIAGGKIKIVGSAPSNRGENSLKNLLKNRRVALGP
jgi:hypothetical protein